MSESTEQRFRIVFEQLGVVPSEDADAVQVVRLMIVDQRELEQIDELRRLSEAIAEPESRVYTAT